jgi:hypothetical protein
LTCSTRCSGMGRCGCGSTMNLLRPQSSEPPRGELVPIPPVAQPRSVECSMLAGREWFPSELRLDQLLQEVELKVRIGHEALASTQVPGSNKRRSTSIQTP